MATVYETVFERMSSYPGLYRSRTEVLLQLLTSGQASAQWVDGEAVWNCPKEVRPTLEEIETDTKNFLLSVLPLMPQVPSDAVDIVMKRVRDRFIAAQEMAQFSAELVDLDAPVKSFKAEAFERSLFKNVPSDITDDWQQAVEEVHCVLSSQNYI